MAKKTGRAKTSNAVRKVNASAKRGLALRRQLYGEENVDNIIGQSDEFMSMFQDFTNDVCFGNLWHRPGLPHKIRSLLSLAILASKAQAGGVKRHVRSALRQGWTKEEIGEVFLHVYVYAGVYASLSSFIAAKEEFELMEWEQASAKAKGAGKPPPSREGGPTADSPPLRPGASALPRSMRGAS